MSSEEINIYEFIGGEPTFQQLVKAFYARVEKDTLLRPMFPTNMKPGMEWQKLFLIHYFGGPGDYLAQRGHPRLRLRHSPFAINREAKDHWLAHMLAAIDEVNIPEPARTEMRDYFIRVAELMINQFNEETRP